MALLISCWFIIESFIIPDGFQKWFYLSFFINRLVLFFCQIFLWLKLPWKWLLVIIRFISFLGLCIFRFFRSCVIYFVSFTKLKKARQVVEEQVEHVGSLQNYNQNRVSCSYICLSLAPQRGKLKTYENQAHTFEEKNDYTEDFVLHEVEKLEGESDTRMNEYLSSIYSPNSSIEDENSSKSLSSISSSNSPAATDQEMIEYWPSVCDSNSPVMAREEETDGFYKKYTERMKWFDILNYDRTCGISAILNKQLGTPSSLGSIEAVDFSVPHISWTKMDRKRLLRSLESDFELVYVAQSCLSWEALHYQYRKVEALASSCGSQNGVFDSNVAEEFQKFQVLLDRFMEDERCEGKRVWNYVQGRFSLNSLLQVPKVSGFSEVEKEDEVKESVNLKELLKVIEQCIKAFWLFVKTDKKLPWWKFSSSLWTTPPVEDPRNLQLLADLTTRLRKREFWLKDLRGKKRCWLKRVVNPYEESQREDILFAMIEMKLVSRVLQMSVVTSSQLQWCQEKIDNLEFLEGMFVRACTAGPLFPP